MPGTTAPLKYLSAAEAAQFLHSTADAVYQLIKTEGLPARRVGRRWLVEATELDAWLRTRGSSAPEPWAGADPVTPDVDWVTQQIAKFTADDLRRAAAVFARLARELDAANGDAA